MKKILISLLFLFSVNAFAIQESYLFSTADEKNRFTLLTAELRCLVCQNQTLAESNAPLANDLRQKIYEKINQGESDKQIIEYLTARYGKFILYRPPFNLSTILLWLGPFIVLALGVIFLFYNIFRRKPLC